MMAVDAQIKAKRLEMINMESYIMYGQSETNGERKRVPQVGCSMGEVLQMGVVREDESQGSLPNKLLNADAA